METSRRNPLPAAGADFFHPQRRRAWIRIAQLGLFVAAPILVTLVIFGDALGANMFAGDFAHGPWPAAWGPT